MKPTLLAIVPAKQRSSRLPNKNLRLLGGKPLVVHTIECALQSKSIDRLIVSTDSPAIREISLVTGAEAPFLRPPDLATASAATEDVILHAVQFLKEQENLTYDYFVVLQPTSPLRTPDDIDQAFQLLLTGKVDSVVSVSKMAIPASHLVVIANGLLKSAEDYQLFPRELSFFKLNGAIYISRMDILLKTGRLLGEKVSPFFMPDSRALDIDTPDDLLFADIFLSKGGKMDDTFIPTQSDQNGN
jgi:CMP-N,N'-diacetyllegionaminic acid synthase